MPTKLTKGALRRAVDHLVKFGDTDVLPLSCENVFLAEEKQAIVNELSGLDLDSLAPMQSVEMIAPKSRYGFRIVHQLPLLEALLFTASIIEIGGGLEKIKRSTKDYGPFAYRFETHRKASLFQEGHGYRDWLQWQRDLIEIGNFSNVVYTDIADFYQRIYLHRIENTLDSASKKKGVNKFVTRLIKQIRSRQSHGIPVGGSASRVIAEAVLVDTDNALAGEGYVFTRYMDDYRLFLKPDQTAYQALAFLAEQLAAGEGLSLNAQKTRVFEIEEAQQLLDRQLGDVYDAAEQDAIDALSGSLYFEENPSDADIDKLRSMNLVDALGNEIHGEIWEFSKIRAIFRGLRLTQDCDAVDYLTRGFQTYIPFMKEMVLFFDVMRLKGQLNEAKLAEAVSTELKTGVSRFVPSTRVWLLEMFVRECLTIANKTITEIESGDTAIRRQTYLLRGLNNDLSYFRKHKTRFEERNAFEKYYFLLGASCLPEDEFKTWTKTVKGAMKRPLDQLFCTWVLTKRGLLREVIRKRAILARE